jgi:hypothetical protein
MSSLIVSPYGHVRNASVGSIFGKRENEMRRGIENLAHASFTSHPVQSLTDAVIRERLDFCIVKAAELYRDLGWTRERIIDELPSALKAHLNGTTWEPSKRGSWAARDDIQ